MAFNSMQLLIATIVYFFLVGNVHAYSEILSRRRHRHHHGHRQEAVNKFTILHTNDVHAHIDEFNEYGSECPSNTSDCFGGIARLKTIVDRFRASRPTLLMDAGDQFQGTLFYTFYKGEKIAQAMNYLRYNVMTIGNHEFDDGDVYLAKFIQSLHFPVVNCNFNRSTSPALARVVKPYQIFAEYKLAVVGIINAMTSSIAVGAIDIQFFDPVKAVQYYVDELAARGIRRIVLLSHNGYKEDLELAKRTRGIDLIIGGHSHSFLSPKPDNPLADGIYPTAVQNLDGTTTYVVQAYRFGEYIGRVDLEYNDHDELVGLAGAPIHLDSTITKHQAVQAMVQTWRGPFKEALGDIVAHVDIDMPNDKCKVEECVLGNLFVDGLKANRSVDLAMLNGGAIRTGLYKGPISYGDVLTVLPFSNAISIVEYTGRDLWQVLERVAANRTEDGKRIMSIVHWSGLKFTFNVSRPEFSRVVEARVLLDNQWASLQHDRVYTVLTSDFMLIGGDHILVDIKGTFKGRGPVLGEAVTAYLRAMKHVNPRLEDRIVKVV